jgi:hypothetical protein
MEENSKPEPTDSKPHKKTKSYRTLVADEKTLVIAWMRDHAEELHDKTAKQLMTLVSDGVGFPVSDSTMPFLCDNAGVRLKVRPKRVKKPEPEPEPEPPTLENLAERLDRLETAITAYRSETVQATSRLVAENQRLNTENQQLKAPLLPFDEPGKAAS